ncbi:Biotin/lipoyl attachment:Carbamoyl-phosphate synthase L chain, ATP-binding [gamma proteobacterium HdN1]|nr:Biotin/lipoyl attachment:Carbamoyl-phosphate synthase L chain, ATP-binding [gamma proteobacterium HdN1]
MINANLQQSQEMRWQDKNETAVASRPRTRFVKQAPRNFYANNPLIHKNRRRQVGESEWVKQFNCEDLRPLIICRGPIRKEVMDVWEEMGIHEYGILLSEKDSITYNSALAPELRQLTRPEHVHRVPDYTGVDKEERTQRINQIIAIAKENRYDSVFAGYGFMAEDEALVSALENAGLTFIGPCSRTVRDAGAKDEAKRTALQVNVTVTPGIDNLTALTLLRKASDLAALKTLANAHKLGLAESLFDGKLTLEHVADEVLNASYKRSMDLISIAEIAKELEIRLQEIFHKYPNNRMRLKAIGGGGGKGQRILAAPSSYNGSLEEQIKQASTKGPELFREILSEVKTTGVGDNKNVLIELNIEVTRHQEIQVIGNGEWCMTLGARDCSVQMHEQKLLEISQTREMLADAIASAKASGKAAEEKALQSDLEILIRMEEESERFGVAVGLDSVSTFECIVDRDTHFFMEMNTRIQVEHRVSELCYTLRFANPKNPEDYFDVDSLVEAMTLLAKFGKQLPKPTRIPRERASVEVRLNATNRALKPHAGGIINYWSDAIEGEIRDDQGISLKNPDTGQFIKYHLAGAYDSNVALILSVGNNRRASYERMAEVLRRTRFVGENLCTNLDFHYGLVHWLLAEHVHAKATTGFAMPYLTQIGLLKQATNRLDIEYAYAQIKAAYRKRANQAFAGSDELPAALKAIDSVLDRKNTLLLRPIEMLLEEPHQLSGWLSVNKSSVRFDGDTVVWTKNPIAVLDDTYHYLNMDYREDLPAAACIWKHDSDVLQSAVAFYADLQKHLGGGSWETQQARLADNTVPEGLTEALWSGAQAAHAGYQAGLELLTVLVRIAHEVGFYEIKVNADLTITIPERLRDKKLQDEMLKVLVPPPATKADELVAVCGGMFYGREAPGLPAFIQEGDHIEAGQAIYIVEVMKMFNKIYAPFACTIDKLLMENIDGTIVKQGQPLFKVTPDERVVEEDPAEVLRRTRTATDRALAGLL